MLLAKGNDFLCYKRNKFIDFYSLITVLVCLLEEEEALLFISDRKSVV